MCLAQDTAEASIPRLKPYWQQRYRKEASRSWDKFYKRNGDRFFKDRHWLSKEFPGLLDVPNSIGLELGCGTGSFVFPYLAANPTAHLYCCDFAASAIALIQAHTQYAELHQTGRLNAFVADIVPREGLPDPLATVSDESLDFATAIYILSAIPPERHKAVLQLISRKLKPCGHLILRDYHRGDESQARFQKQEEVPKLQDWLYVRQDGTLTWFFDAIEFQELCIACGLQVEQCERIEKPLENAKLGISSKRFYLQAVLCKL